jgi:hypothetical protein
MTDITSTLRLSWIFDLCHGVENIFERYPRKRQNSPQAFPGNVVMHLVEPVFAKFGKEFSMSYGLF